MRIHIWPALVCGWVLAAMAGQTALAQRPADELSGAVSQADAIDESDKFLDRSLMQGKQAVRIIHGFGTGALRKAVREHLRTHPAVKSWRPGNENEGGDGATVAVLEE